MIFNIAGAHAVRIQRKYVIFNVIHYSPPFRKTLRRKTSVTIPGHLYFRLAISTFNLLAHFTIPTIFKMAAVGSMLFIAQVLVHFRLKKLLDGLFKEFLEKI